MAGGGNFIHRVMSDVANELIVNGFANRFAVRTSKKMQDISNRATQVKKEVSEQVSKNLESFKNQ